MSKTPRLDVLLYAHDGRGLGHVSRTAAVGMALRRCHPELRVLLVTGSRMAGELIGDVPLDWLKLPSYETEVKDGKSRGIDGRSGFSDAVLGELRSLQLRDIVRLYRPRAVLCDHSPQGKHRELLPALDVSQGRGTRWLLGVRGIVGEVKQVKSELARNLFREHYHALFWFGDSGVLGPEPMEKLVQLYGVEPLECGYVSRLAECCAGREKNSRVGEEYCGTLSVPWLGEATPAFLQVLADALAVVGPEHGPWRLFVNPDSKGEIAAMFQELSHCRLEPPSGRRYADALLQSMSALIFGGYNSLMDVLGLGLPSTVVIRQMGDGEQLDHLEKLSNVTGNMLQAVSESGINAEQLAELLLRNMNRERTPLTGINLHGAENAADRIAGMLQ